MTSTPRFSVIMPLYNKASYVRKAVESVVGQTCRDWELIVVDDGSTDGGGDIVAAIPDPRIRLARQENAGVSEARNRGVALSESLLLCFLDADDWWEPTFLEEMAGLIKRNPGAGIYGTGYWIVKNGRKRNAPIGVADGFVEGEINYCQVYARTLCMPLTSISVCIPHKIFDDVGGFNPQLQMAEDFDLWIRIAVQYRVVFINKPLSNYNQDVNPITRAIGQLKPPETHFAFNVNHLKLYMEQDSDVQLVVEQVQIICIKQYYLSKQYYHKAQEVLDHIDLERHKGKGYIDYLLRPRWISVIENFLHNIARRIK